MLRRYRWIAGLAVAGTVFATLLVVNPRPMPAQTPAPIKIGYVDVFSGAAAAYGLEGRHAFEMLVEDLNGKGGILGRKIEVLARDDQARAAESAKLFQEMYVNERVDFVIGATISSTALADSAQAKRMKKLLITPSARSARVLGAAGHRYIARVAPDSVLEARTATAYLKALPGKRYFIVAPDYEYGRRITADTIKFLKEVRPDIVVVGEQYPKLGETDFTPFISAILAAKPDIVLSAEFASDAIAFIRQAQPYGLFERTRYFGFANGEPDIVGPLGKDMPGKVMATAQYPFYAVDNTLGRAFAANFRRKTNAYPSGNALGGYLAGQFLFAAIQRAGTTDMEKVIDALGDLTVDTPVGSVSMRKCDQQALVPDWAGETGEFDAQFGFRKLVGIIRLEGKEGFRSCEEIEKERTAG